MALSNRTTFAEEISSIYLQIKMLSNEQLAMVKEGLQDGALETLSQQLVATNTIENKQEQAEKKCNVFFSKIDREIAAILKRIYALEANIKQELPEEKRDAQNLLNLWQAYAPTEQSMYEPELLAKITFLYDVINGAIQKFDDQSLNFFSLEFSPLFQFYARTEVMREKVSSYEERLSIEKNKIEERKSELELEIEWLQTKISMARKELTELNRSLLDVINEEKKPYDNAKNSLLADVEKIISAQKTASMKKSATSPKISPKVKKSPELSNKSSLASPKSPSKLSLNTIFKMTKLKSKRETFETESKETASQNLMRTSSSFSLTASKNNKLMRVMSDNHLSQSFKQGKIAGLSLRQSKSDPDFDMSELVSASASKDSKYSGSINLIFPSTLNSYENDSTVEVAKLTNHNS